MDEYSNTIIVIACVLIMIGGVAGVFYDRFKHEKGFGIRVIQFLAVILIIPTILILALNTSISSETVATLLGTLIGYILSGIGKDESNKQ